MTRTEKLLRELVAIPSVNPALAPAGDPGSGEGRVGEFVAVWVGKAGLDVEWLPVLPGRSNVVARLRPRGRVERTVVLAPHLDTVGGEDIDGRLFSPRVRGGRLYGRGACDTKGSVAAMLSAVAELGRKGRRPARTEIIFVGLVDEENAQAGSRALIRGGFGADLAIVGEPTRLKVVTAHKGALWLEFQVRGKAAHGARPELGENAVRKMAKVVEALEGDYARTLRRTRHRLLGRATVNVGAISGGRQPNIVPDECRILVDRRTLPGEGDCRVVMEMKRLLRGKGLRVTVRGIQEDPCGPLETDPRLPLVRQFLGVAGQKAPAGVDYFSDAAVLGSGGIPSVVFGPGDIAQAHTPEEWILLSQLEAAKELLVCFLQSLP